MKKDFSVSWLSSKQPRKQRKYTANAPLHTRHKFLSSHLSKQLREKYGKRSLPLRKGDEVLIMRGSFKKKKAKVAGVDLKKTRVTLENFQRAKKDGTKVNVFFAPRALQIITLTLDDKKRISVLEKRKISEQGKEKNAPDKSASK